MVRAIVDVVRTRPKVVRVAFSNERIGSVNRIVRDISEWLQHLEPALCEPDAIPFFLASFVMPENFQSGLDRARNPRPPTEPLVHANKTCRHPITLDNIAQSTNLSTSFFSRKFRQDTGYAPIEYFNHLRIQKACQLLHFSDLRINEVAVSTGIDDPFYFSRLFKKQMGVSPAEYRKSEGVNRKP